MRLKTAKTTSTEACKEQLIRGGFKTISPWQLRLQNKPGEVVYGAHFHSYGYLGDRFVRIDKGTVVGPKTISFVSWDWTNTIIFSLV